MIALLRTFIFSMVVLSMGSSPAWAVGGGSSGVGSGLPVYTGIVAALPDDFVQVQGSTIQDGPEPILSLTPIQFKDLDSSWAPVRLGAVNGYEYRPGPQSTEQNAWVVCTPEKDACAKLTPLSKTNRKIPALMGSLVRVPVSSPSSAPLAKP